MFGIFKLLSLVIVISLHSCQAIPIDCPTNGSTPSEFEKNTPFPDPEKVKLGDNYETTIRFTNWYTNETAKFIERNFNGSLVITKRTPTIDSTWYRGTDRIIYFESSNAKDNHTYVCTGAPSEAQQNVYGLSPTLTKFFGENTFSFGSILSRLVSSPQYSSGKLEDSTWITAGLETMRWRGCANNVDNGDNIQVNVYMTGAKTSQAPYNGNFRNPQVMAFHVQVYRDIHDTNSTTPTQHITEHVSFDIVTLDLANMSDKDLSLTPPRGKYCENLPKVELSHELPSRIEAQLEYVDSSKKVMDDFEISYDEEEHVFSMVMDFKADTDIPLVGNSSFIGTGRLVHDFKYGIQYVLSRDGSVCHHVQPIDSKMGDVHLDENATLFMRNPAEILFHITNEGFYYAGKVDVDDGILCESYVSKKPEADGGQTVVEILYTSDGWTTSGIKAPFLHSVVQYHVSKSGVLMDKTVIRLNLLKIGNQALNHNVYACLPNHKDTSIFYINLNNTTMADLKKVGLKQAQDSLIKAVAHVGNFSVLRITHFTFLEMDGKLLASFIISQNSGISQPAKTAYLQEELTVDEVHQILNDSINATNVLKVHIPAEDAKLPGLTITSNEFGQLPSHVLPPSPGFIGYSGRAMFVLGLFMFIFGAVVVIGSCVFYVKRQSIRGMAYQVFE